MFGSTIGLWSIQSQFLTNQAVWGMGSPPGVGLKLNQTLAGYSTSSLPPLPHHILQTGC